MRTAEIELPLVFERGYICAVDCAEKQAAVASANCEVRFDNLTRQLYATDASVYQIEPVAVAFPRNALQASSVIRAGADAGLEIIPRGAGTGLVGGAIGPGLIVEFAKFNRQITALDLERQTVRVGAGVVLDQLNDFLSLHGFRFGPDVATSSRATLGGMIANNSSGSHVPVYGTTADHVEALELVLADGRVEWINADGSGLWSERAALENLIRAHAPEIQERFPPGLLKRWPGYALDKFFKNPAHLPHLLAGSEGTLAAICSAELKIVPVPKQKGLGILFFASVAEAMEATVQLLDLKPAAIEHIDRVLFDQTKGQLPFKSARDLLELDARPCESILLVEFFDDVEEQLAALARKKLGLRTLLLTKPADMNRVWSLRKAGLSLLTGCPGDAKPVTCIEDTAVRPEQLPEYVAGLESIFQPLGLNACYYGHAATGLLHVRPVLDLHNSEDLKKFRWVSDQVSALVRQFGGSLAAEHGVGIARTEYMPEHLGPGLIGLMRGIKSVFDPRHRFNPGKIIGDGRYRIDKQLRLIADFHVPLPFEPVLAFAAKDHSFTGNLEQCNGCGGCRKDSPTMCPTFLATGEEFMSTRGRANAIRAVLELRGQAAGSDPLMAVELEAALSNCLSCKACATECPSNVNLPLLKAELLHAQHTRHGLSWREWLLSSPDELGRMAHLMPSLANAAIQNRAVRWVFKNVFGLSPKRPLPSYASDRFDEWFARHSVQRNSSHAAARGKVILWDDTFVRFHEPEIGRAAVRVLEAAGFEVMLVEKRRCCGRPAFSQGHLNKAAQLGTHNLQRLLETDASLPILFLEPSCYSMFADDYRELNLAGAGEIAGRSFLFEQFADRLLQEAPDALRFQPRLSSQRVVIHAHCHAKALLNPKFMARAVGRIPGVEALLLDSGCCGMAGAFGALDSKYELSIQIASPLIEKLNKQPAGTVLIASGTSCRHQIEHLAKIPPLHFAELLARNLA